MGARAPTGVRPEPKTLRHDGRVFTAAGRTHQRVHVTVDIVCPSGPLSARTQTEQVLPELLADGAVEQEVDGMVRVHEQLGHRLQQAQVDHDADIDGDSRVQLGSDHGHVDGHREQEEDEGHGEKHHRDAAVLDARPPLAGVQREA